MVAEVGAPELERLLPDPVHSGAQLILKYEAEQRVWYLHNGCSSHLGGDYKLSVCQRLMANLEPFQSTLLQFSTGNQAHQSYFCRSQSLLYPTHSVGYIFHSSMTTYNNNVFAIMT